ncbi:MAG: hypothetical protein QM811_30865 [Pirellulales bacterium]
MARWPKTTWTTIWTYGTVFVLFPLLSYLAWLWVARRSVIRAVRCERLARLSSFRRNSSPPWSISPNFVAV